MERIETHLSYGGRQEVWKHLSTTLGCEMRLGVYLPPQAPQRPRECPVLYWLSGLTCTEQNFITKADAQRTAARLGCIIVAPDTSPRGATVPNDEAYDLGQGASFYLNATEPPWATHFQMYDYIVKELPMLVEAQFESASTRLRSIFGHSMGGHGALMIALKNPDRYASVSAFSPILAPSRVPWGIKAFTAYLGEDRSTWAQWDSSELLAQATAKLPLRIDQGLNDEFLASQLQTENFSAVCERANYPLNLNLHPGYDHSYYFIASFMEEHIEFHHRAWLR
ncbi:MAG: S-formylglutathione hydrolase [Ideonella sp. MAG2]|nr:MAG: S-formylglutathione hydrolase [Ideonella sp. MAG2]